jgi:hypothetical protein
MGIGGASNSGSGETLTSQPEANVNPALQTTPANEEKTVARLESADLLNGGEGESALPEDKKQEALEELEDDWQHDPINPRNWTKTKKYANMSLVR